MGPGSGATYTYPILIPAYETANGFNNTAMTFSGTGDLRNNLFSTGYAQASGGPNILLQAQETFVTSAINTIGKPNLAFSFGVFKSTLASTGSELRVEFSTTSGATWFRLPVDPLPTGSGSATWYYRTTTVGLIPQAANVLFRFINNAAAGNTLEFRIDDVNLAHYGGVPIIQFPSDLSIVAPADTSMCLGSTFDMQGSGEGAVSYLWSPGGQSTQLISISPPALGIYTYSVTETDVNGCSATTLPINITVNPNPTTFVSTPNPNICSGESTTLSAFGPGTSTFNWSPVTGLSAPFGSPVTASPATTTTYTVSGFTAAGCSSTATVIVNVTRSPVVTVSQSTRICAGQSATLTAGNANPGVTTYSWSPATGLNSTVGSSVIASPTATTTYTVTGTSSSCSGTNRVIVTVTEPPAVTVNPSTASICNGQSVTLTGSGALGSTVIPVTFTSNTVRTIPDNDATGISSPITVSGISPVTLGSNPVVSVFLTITHTFDADLEIELVSPSGSRITLSAQNGGSGDNYMGTSFTSTAATSVVNGTAPFVGTYLPQQPFSNLSGAVNGTWQLVVRDIEVAFTGQLQQWGITFNTVNSLTGYAWTPTTGLSSATTPTTVASPTTTTTYTLSVSDAAGCVGTNTSIVNVTPIPAAPIATNNGPVCAGDTIKLFASNVVNGSYSWTGPLGFNSTQQNPFIANATAAAAGTYSVTVSVNGCRSAVSTTVVVVRPIPNIVATATPAVICLGQNSTLSATGATTYSWGPAINLSGQTGAVVTATPPATTTYTVTGTSLGCSASATVVVTIAPVPSVTASASPAAICSGQSSALTASGANTYTWTPITGLSPTTGASVTASPTTTTTYTVTGSIGSCSATATAIVTVSPTPNTAATASPAAICAGQSSTISATGATTYSWSPSTGLSATVGATVIASPIVTTTYTVTGTTGSCSKDAIVVITVTPAPTVAATATPAAICTGQSSVLSATGATTYSWSPNTNLSATTGATVTASPLTTITYTVTGTTNGCTGTATVVVTVSPTPAVTVTAAPAAICAGQSSVLSASGAGTYSWSPNVALSATAGATVTASPLVTTTYTVTGTSGTCTGTATVVVTVNPTPTVTASATPGTICAGASSSLTAGGAATYTWSPNINLSSTTGAVITASPPVTTTYTVTGLTAASCNNTATVVVTVTPLPTVAVTPAAPAICPGQSTGLTASGATTYTWSPGLGLSGTTGAVVIANPSVTTTYNVTGTANGCSSTATVVVQVLPSLPVTATASPAAICAGQSSTLSASGAATFSWTPITALNGTTGATVIATPANTITYVVTGTSGSCSNTASVIVTVNSNPTVAATATPATICAGQSSTLSASGATSYSWSPSTGLTGTTGASVSASPTITTVYNVTGTTGSCSATATVQVTVNPLPTVAVTPSAPAICPGQSTGLTASGATTYTWSPAIGLSGTSGAIVTANPSVTTTYNVTGTSNGCVSTSSVIVQVLPSLPVAASASPAAICSGQTSALSATGAATYSWSPSAGLSGTTGATVTFNGTTPGSYTYTVTGTSGSCSNSATVVVTVNPNPTVAATATPATICEGQNSTLVATGATTYSWSPSTGLSTTTGSTVTASPIVTTVYNVTGMTGSCSATATVQVTVNPLPVVAVTPAAPAICPGQSTGLTASGATTFSWSPAIGLSGTTGAIVTANPSVTTTYNVTGTSNGCSATSSVVVQVLPTLPVAASASPAAICSGQTSALSASGAATYSWSPSAGLGATTGATVTFNGTTPGSYTYTVTGTSGSCSNTATVVVTVNPNPTVTATAAPATICEGQSSTLSATGATSYSWSPNTSLSSPTGATVTANPIITTIYTVTGTSGSCSSTATVQVTVTPLPTVAVTPAAPAICPGQSTGLTASGATTYTWSPGLGLSGTTGAIVTANPSATTTYNVTGTANGCSSTATVVVQVLPSLPVTATASPAAICAGQSSTLSASGAATFSWTPSTGLGGTTGATVTATPTTTITYVVTGTSGSCSNTASVIVTVNPNPTVTATATPATICEGASSALTATGAASYSWSPNNNLSSPTGATVTANPTVTTVYTVTGTSGSCSSTAAVQVTVTPLPTVAVTPAAPAICPGQSTGLTASGATTYSWSPGLGLSGTTGAIVTANPSATTTYNVTGTANGCSSTATVVVQVLPSLPVTATASPAAICAGQSSTLSASGAATFSWTPSTGLGGTTGATVTATPNTTITYVVTGTSGSCSNTASVIVTVNPNPTVVATATPATICEGQSSTLSATGASSYSWSPNTNLSSPTGATVTANPTITTIYTVTGTSGSCSSTATVQVTVTPLPTVAVTPSAPAICPGQSTGLTASGATTYSWSPGLGLSGTTGAIVTANPSATTTYNVTGTANGCSSTATVVVQVLPSLPVTATASPAAICAGRAPRCLLREQLPSAGLHPLVLAALPELL